MTMESEVPQTSGGNVPTTSERWRALFNKWPSAHHCRSSGVASSAPDHAVAEQTRPRAARRPLGVSARGRGGRDHRRQLRCEKLAFNWRSAMVLFSMCANPRHSRAFSILSLLILRTLTSTSTIFQVGPVRGSGRHGGG